MCDKNITYQKISLDFEIMLSIEVLGIFLPTLCIKNFIEWAEFDFEEYFN